MVATDPTGWTSHTDDFHRGMTWKLAVRAATTASITIATALNNADVLDGVTLATGDRVLVKDQATGSQNGIYIVSASPARAPDMDQDSTTSVPAQEVLGAVVIVFSGTANAGTMWRNTNTTAPTLGTTALTFAQIGGVSAGAVTTSGLTMATARLLGRTTAATGAIEEITVGSGLSLAAGSLTATGGGTGTVTTVEEVDGSPTDSAVTKIVFPNGTLSIASHVATYTAAAGSASDPVATAFGTPDTTFEFDTSSLTGLTVIGSAAVEDANTTIAGHLYYRDATSTTAYMGRYLASPSMPFTAITKITDAPIRANYNEVSLLIGVANPATGAFVVNAIGSATRTIGSYKYTNRTTFSTTYVTPSDHVEVPLWLGMVANSTTSIDFYYSYNGYLWVKYDAARDPALTVGSVGIAMKSENTISFSVAFDYLRIWNSAKTFPGN